jgi:acyl dehydratase
MALDAERLLSHQFSPIRQSYDQRDAILYALGVGLGQNPTDEADLDFLLETRLRVLPSFAVTLSSPGMWIRDPAFGVDFAKLVHAEQQAIFHRPLPEKGDVVATPRVAALWDRGEGRGAVLVVERTVSDAETGDAYATVRQTLLLRGDGGFGGPPQPHAAPLAARGEPDHIVDVATSPRAALIYRLSGDWNPLHADPAAAARAGFSRPILHGLASYGIAAHAVAVAAGGTVAEIACRFSGVVMPGDTMSFRIWQIADQEFAFEAMVAERKVLDRGTVRTARR